MPGPKLYLPPPQVEGIPTKQELDAIPRLYTWEKLKEIVASGELGDLKRHPILAVKYASWAIALSEKYGSTEKYLIDVRLPWKTPPTRYGNSTPSSSHGMSSPAQALSIDGTSTGTTSSASSTSISTPPPFTYDYVIPTLDLPDEYLTFNEDDEVDEDVFAVLPNDWPYNVPKGVEHCIVWSKLPIFHPSLVDNDQRKWAKISREGFAGWTGTSNGGKEDWFTEGGGNVDRMVRKLWPVEEFECAWFVNPPRLQSVPGLSHFHIFARLKTPQEQKDASDES